MSISLFVKPSIAPSAVDVSRLPDGGMILRNPIRLEPYARCIGDMLEHWTKTDPDRTLFSERTRNGEWRKISYAEARSSARNIGQALLDKGLSAERPIAILSENSIDFALLVLGAMYAGIPVAPISPAYALMSSDYAKLKYVMDLIDPGLIFVSHGSRYETALAALAFDNVEIVVEQDPCTTMACTQFSALLATPESNELQIAFAGISPDTIAKILLTSGSTGMPKGVINTQRMLCSNQQSWSQIYHFLSERPPVLLDWLPWNHTFGSNTNFGLTIRHGGTLYLDSGKPVPGKIQDTVNNLREIAPTIYFNVPKGYAMLLPYLEQDEALREQFFSRLDFLCYAGAALPKDLWNRLQKLAVAVRGERILIVSAWGATETAPGATAVYFETDHVDNIGLPIPGCEIKMVPNADKLEMRVRGPNVTPGYWKRQDLTEAAFDEDGFYCIGDAGRLIDEKDPSKGIRFDGRIAEDFKLTSGTWVSVGGLRLKAIAAGAGLIQDAVITGHDRDEIGILIFPDQEACRRLCPGQPADTPFSAIIADHRVREKIASALDLLASQSTGSSTRLTRALLMAEPPSVDANEITDKGYVNQRAVLHRRAQFVERIYAASADAEIICLSGDKVQVVLR